MQGLLVLLFAFTAVALAQQTAASGGCCFYSGANFTGEIRCTSEPSVAISSAVGIRSFYCTEQYSAAILHSVQNGAPEAIQELVDCGDTVDQTTSAIPVSRITIGECLERRCCCYTGEAKNGDEFCINGNDVATAELQRVQTNGTFRVAECVAAWRAVVLVLDAPNIEIQCGETLDIPAGTRFTGITTYACPVVRSAAVEEEGFSADQFVADAATVDQFDNTFADQAVDEFADIQFDQAAVDNFETFDDDSFVGDAASADQFDNTFAADQAVDEFADVQFDQAAVDNFETFDDDSFVGDAASADQFESTFAADQAVDQFTDAQFDQAAVDNFETFDDDSFVGDAQLDQAVADMAADEQFVDASYESGLDEQFDQFADQ